MTDPAPPTQPRRRHTRRRARVAEALAKVLISIGGIGTIVAVTLIFAFLVSVVVPIFRGASAGAVHEVRVPARERLLHFAVDEYRTTSWAVYGDGTLATFRLDDGAPLAERPLLDGAQPTAAAFDLGGTGIFGFADGSIREARIGFTTLFRALEDVPESLRGLPEGESAVLEGSVVQRVSAEQLRVQQLTVEVEPALDTRFGAPIVLLDRSQGAAEVVAALDASGALRLLRVRSTKNLLTGKTTLKTSGSELPYAPSEGRGPPQHLVLSGAGDMVYLAWEDGHCQRFNAQDLERPVLAEELDLVPDASARLTCLATMIGKTTLVSGDSAGRVRGWFLTRTEGVAGTDGSRLTAAHEIAAGGASVTALAPSPRSRAFAAARDDGAVQLVYMTSGDELLRLRTGSGEAVRALSIAPKQDGLYAWTDSGLWSWEIDARHPEASLTALFTPIWYEGYPRPEHVWQSSSGTDDFEPKLGLVPLVFGTLKATLYSMLFGVPLALLAAIYTAEFLSPKLRAPLKAVTETMAGLPSVVLGFLAALVIAPFVQEVLSATLMSFLTIPAALLLGAHLWQVLPSDVQVRLGGWQRFLVIASGLPIGVLAAAALGPVAERALFAGDLRGWLDGRVGSTTGGWLLLLAPLSALGVALLSARLDPWLRRKAAGWSGARYARVELLRFLAGSAAALGLAWLIAAVFDGIGLDPRGSFLGPYDPRNALVVGFVMGFAIIPIVYTLSEDALSSVPEHLRLASLGAGATPWQTAVRIVIPTAMSGLFSAIMIGLGRAVGETMIVLMATGNTPVMDWNVFNGFRTLSANIAVELPEAVAGDTHYRTLFLAALVLFAVTFVLNTLAEIVRQRFRRRAYQL